MTRDKWLHNIAYQFRPFQSHGNFTGPCSSSACRVGSVAKNSRNERETRVSLKYILSPRYAYGTLPAVLSSANKVYRLLDQNISRSLPRTASGIPGFARSAANKRPSRFSLLVRRFQTISEERGWTIVVDSRLHKTYVKTRVSH